MSINFDHSRYLSPFSWRYGSEEMRAIWSEIHKRRLWRRIWIEIAHAQQLAGLVTAAQVTDLQAHADQIDMGRAEAIEAEIQHDLMAEVKVFAEQCPIGGGIIHLGATSADIEDNADALRLRDSLRLLLPKLARVLERFAELMVTYADQPAIAFTHLQPAEPTTTGYRFALYAQDLLEDYQSLKSITESIRGKGFKGAVGSRASYTDLFEDTSVTPQQFEDQVMNALELPPYPITGQTYPRKQDYTALAALGGLAGSLYKFAFDLRLLQSPVIGEWQEGFGAKQIGSSAMPFKRNPINAEKMDSLARFVASLTQTAWGNAAHSLLERTLDDSANRREILPSAFLACDELLIICERILKRLSVNTPAVARNLAQYGLFSATERVMMAAVKNGADRQEIHEVLRQLSMQAWEAVTIGDDNPLAKLVAEDAVLNKYLSSAARMSLMEASNHVGDTPERTRAFAAHIRKTIG